MLIQLGDDIGDCLDPCTLTIDEQAGLEQIAHNARNGFHLLSGEMNLLDRLASSPFLGDVAKSLYLSAANKSVQRRGIWEHIDVYVVATTNLKNVEIDVVEGATRIRIPLSHFGMGCFGGSTVLLLESVSDFLILESIARWYLRVSGLNDSLYSFQTEDGPGGNTVNKYVQKQAQGTQLCLCVVDSDKLSPGDALSNTAENVLNADDPSVHTTAVHILDAHEIENLIPMSVLEKVAELRGCAEGSMPRIVLRCLAELSQLGFPDTQRYWDYKDGVLCQTLNGRVDANAFWKGHYERVKNHFRKTCQSENCHSEACERVLLPAWPLARETREYMQSEGLELSLPMDQELADLWQRLGRLLINWGIADLRTIT